MALSMNAKFTKLFVFMIMSVEATTYKAWTWYTLVKENTVCDQENVSIKGCIKEREGINYLPKTYIY